MKIADLMRIFKLFFIKHIDFKFQNLIVVHIEKNVSRKNFNRFGISKMKTAFQQ